MAWLAVDKNGKEHIYTKKPIRGKWAWDCSRPRDHYIQLQEGAVEHLYGKKLTFEDEPVEI
jgi:hypothetical protein